MIFQNLSALCLQPVESTSPRRFMLSPTVLIPPSSKEPKFCPWQGAKFPFEFSNQIQRTLRLQITRCTVLRGIVHLRFAVHTKWTDNIAGQEKAPSSLGFAFTWFDKPSDCRRPVPNYHMTSGDLLVFNRICSCEMSGNFGPASIQSHGDVVPTWMA